MGGNSIWKKNCPPHLKQRVILPGAAYGGYGFFKVFQDQKNFVNFAKYFFCKLYTNFYSCCNYNLSMI